jgi:hypothetical protein
MHSLAWVQVPVIDITNDCEARRLLKVSAADMTLLRARGIFDPMPRDERVDEIDECLDTPLVRQWSVSAVLVEKDRIYAGLVDRSGRELRSGGLLRYHRASRRVTVYSVPNAIHSLARAADRIFVGTNHGAYMLKDGAFTRIVYRPE